MDYAGPVSAKQEATGTNQHSSKHTSHHLFAWLPRHIHLELVEDLTTKPFLACLDRFVARRNVPAHIYSDHGTNFVVAKNKLQQLKEFFFEKEEFTDRISHYSIQEAHDSGAQPTLWRIVGVFYAYHQEHIKVLENGILLTLSIQHSCARNRGSYK